MQLRKFILFSLLTAALLTSSVFAQTNLSRSGAESGYPAVAVNDEGIILAVWPEGGDEAGILFFSVFKNGAWTSPRNANITGRQAWSPQLYPDDQGRFHIAFADGNSRLNRDIYHAIYDVDEGWKNKTRIWASEENSAWQRLVVENGRIYITWHHENSDPYPGHDVVMQSKLIDEPQWPTAYERFSWTAWDNSTHPGFSVLNGRVHVVYMEGVGDSGPWRLFYKEGPRGSNWNNVPVEEVAGLGYRPELAIDDDQNTHVVWATKDGSFMYREKRDGIWRPAQDLSSKYAEQQFGDIRYRNGLLVACWAQNDGAGRSVYYAKKTVGHNWSDPIQIDQGATGLFPKVWLDNNGYAHFVWQDQGEIYYKKFAVPPPMPMIQLSEESLAFEVEGANPDPTAVTMTNIGEEQMNWTAASDASWLTVSPTSGRLTNNQSVELICTIDALNLDEGDFTGTITITSQEALNSPREISVDLKVLAPPIFAPMSFSGEVLENRALFYVEYVDRLSWTPNPDNKDITDYRIFLNDGVNRIRLTELDASVLEFVRRGILDPTEARNYEVVAVDKRDREGPAATVTLGNVTATTSSETKRPRRPIGTIRDKK
jgi:hypothetical protein